MVWNQAIHFVPKEMIEGGIEIKPEVQLQCPRCQHILEKSELNYHCPLGHVEVFVTPEGYPILKENGSSSEQLIYGGNFKEGVRWQEVISRYKKVVYVTSLEDKEDEVKPLRDYMESLKYDLTVIRFNELNKLDMDDQTIIIFSYRIERKNAMTIILKYLWHPVYRYISGAVIGMRFSKLMRQVMAAFAYKILLAPIVLRKIEACYERYLSDRETAEQFARTYLPPEMLNGKGRQVLDFGCGRGRHVAMLSQLGFSIIGMDPQSHPYWRRILKAHFIVGSAEYLPYFPDAAFDFIICMQVLEYLNDDNTILVHIRRMLKPGGYLLLQVPNEENLHTVLTKRPLTPEPYLQRYYSQSELCSKLEKHGFTIGRVWTEKFYVPFLVSVGNILYEFLLNHSTRIIWDKLIPSRYLGLINILAKPV